MMLEDLIRNSSIGDIVVEKVACPQAKADRGEHGKHYVVLAYGPNNFIPVHIGCECQESYDDDTLRGMESVDAQTCFSLVVKLEEILKTPSVSNWDIKWGTIKGTQHLRQALDRTWREHAAHIAKKQVEKEKLEKEANKDPKEIMLQKIIDKTVGPNLFTISEDALNVCLYGRFSPFIPIALKTEETGRWTLLDKDIRLYANAVAGWRGSDGYCMLCDYAHDEEPKVKAHYRSSAHEIRLQQLIIQVVKSISPGGPAMVLKYGKDHFAAPTRRIRRIKDKETKCMIPRELYIERHGKIERRKRNGHHTI